MPSLPVLVSRVSTRQWDHAPSCSFDECMQYQLLVASQIGPEGTFPLLPLSFPRLQPPLFLRLYRLWLGRPEDTLESPSRRSSPNWTCSRLLLKCDKLLRFPKWAAKVASLRHCDPLHAVLNSNTVFIFKTFVFRTIWYVRTIFGLNPVASSSSLTFCR